MANLIHYNSCPVCKSEQIAKVFVSRDHTVSQESFEIWHCDNCGLRFTQDIPAENEIGRYYQSEDYISHTDTAKGLVNQLYKTARRFTLPHKRNIVTSSTGRKTGKLLDIGCGTGAFIHEMQKAGWSVTGLEPDAGARKMAEKLYGIEPVETSQIDFLPEANFDAITLWHVLEHVHDLEGIFSQFRRLLAVNGKVLIAVPNYTASEADHYGSAWAAYDVPRHLYHFSPTSMKTLANREGFIIEAIKPMMLDAYYISMLSEKHKKGAGGLIQAIFQGTRSGFTTLANPKKCSSIIYILSVKN